MDEQNNAAQETAAQPDALKKSLSYEDKVIKKIAGIATDDIPGIVTLSGGLIGSITDKFRNAEDKTKGITAEVGEKQVALDINVVCEYGKNIPELFDALIESVSKAVTQMTGLAVMEVNMHVEDVLPPAEFAALQAKATAVKAEPPADEDAEASPEE